MKTIIAFLILSLNVFSQTVFTENFNNFLPDTTDTRLIGAWLPGLSETNDFSPGSITLTDANASGTEAGVLYSGSLARIFNGTTDYYWQSPGLNVSNDSLTVVTVFKSGSAGAGGMTIVGSDNGTDREWQVNYNPTAEDLRFDLYVSNSGSNTVTTVGKSILFNDNYHISVARYNGINMQWYLDGVANGTPTAKTGNYDNDATIFTIGRFGTSTAFWDGEIEAVYIYNAALTAKEISETGYLASGWISKNGNVTRESFAFSQTFWDTIGVPLSNTTLGNNQVWQLSYKGKSSDATKTIKAWIGSATTAKSTVYTVTAGTAFATNTVNFGDGFALSSDTLWFASASATDTVSVDDLVLSKARSSTANGGFKGWLGY